MNEWAKNEIEIACKRERVNKDTSEWDYGCACYESAYKAFSSLLADNHSGMSISFTKTILNRLIDGKPLTPIEDTPDVWNCVDIGCGYITYQNKRMSSLFKDVYKNGTIKFHDVDQFLCINKDDPDACSWHNGFINRMLSKSFPITMPYNPPSKPWYVYCTEGLSDPKNGDFNTIGIWYVLKPDGERIEIERFFKESKESVESFVEISRQEYEKCIRS